MTASDKSTCPASRCKKLTLPPVIGVPTHCSDGQPVNHFVNCQITSAFSGLPKLRQLVAAIGRAPLAATLRGRFGDCVHRSDPRIQLAPAAIAIGRKRQGTLHNTRLRSLMRMTAASLRAGSSESVGALRMCRTAR